MTEVDILSTSVFFGFSHIYYLYGKISNTKRNYIIDQYFAV